MNDIYRPDVLIYFRLIRGATQHDVSKAMGRKVGIVKLLEDGAFNDHDGDDTIAMKIATMKLVKLYVEAVGHTLLGYEAAARVWHDGVPAQAMKLARWKFWSIRLGFSDRP